MMMSHVYKLFIFIFKSHCVVSTAIVIAFVFAVVIANLSLQPSLAAVSNVSITGITSNAPLISSVPPASSYFLLFT